MNRFKNFRVKISRKHYISAPRFDIDDKYTNDF